MDKNTVTGIILIILIFFTANLYMSHQQKKYDATHPKPNIKTSIKDSTSQKTSSLTEPSKNNIDSTLNNEELAKEYGVFATARQGNFNDITIENDDCIYTFSTKGGMLKSVELKHYKTFNQKPLIVFSQKATDFNTRIILNKATKPVETAQLNFKLSTPFPSKISKDKEVLELIISDANNQAIYKHSYTIYKSGYVVDFNIDASGIQNEIASNAAFLAINWQQQTKTQELNQKEERTMSGIYYQDNDKNLEEFGIRKDKQSNIETPIKWLSFSQKFFNTTLIAEEGYFSKDAKLQSNNGADTSNLIKDMSAQLQIPLNLQNKYTFNGKWYIGPNNFKELKKLDIGLQKIIPIGGSILGWINKYLVIPIFNFLHKFIPNYGVIILILALIIKLITLPFTYKSQLSMSKMKALKPELDELREKHGKDQATFGAKQMELYQQTGVSPFGGCLPMLLQWPFLIAMYRFFPSAIELRQEKFLWATDLSTYDAIIKFPFNIPLIGNHLSIFALLGVITSFAMTIYTMRNQPQQTGGGEMQEAMQKQMKIMQYIFPFMILFFFNNSSAALSYYFFLFNMLSLVQQWFMTEFMIDETKIRAQIEHNKKNPKKKSNFQQRMEEIMKQQQELKKQQNQRK